MAREADGSLVFDTEINDEGIDQGADEIQRRIKSLQQTVESAGASIREAAEGAYFDSSSVADYQAEIDATTGKIRAFNSFVTLLQNGLIQASTAGLMLAKRLALLPFKVIAAGAKKAAAELEKFRAQSSASNLSARQLAASLTSLRTMLFTKAKSTFISLITSDLKEGIQYFAQYSASFDKAMSNIKNTGSQISANLAALAGNLLTLIEPALTRILSLINSVMVAISGIFAMLGGKSTVSVAMKQTGSYAASLESAAGSAKKAAKAQKEFNAELYGWDELNRQNKKNETDDATSGAGGASGPVWTEVPIDDLLPAWIKDWINRIKKAFAAGDWYGIGEIIAEGLNRGLQVVDDWINHTLRPLGVEWAYRIAEILNGLTSKFNWDLFGKTISDGLAMAFDIGAKFLETYKFENLGRGIGKALNRIFANNDMWHQMARFFAAKFNAMIDTAWGIIQQTLPRAFAWGRTIAGTIAETLNNIQWDRLAEILVDGVKWLARFVEGMLTEHRNWDPFVKKLTDAFSYVVNNVDMERLGRDLNKLLFRVLDLLAGLDWEALGRQIGLFLGSIDWASIVKELGKILFELFKGMLEGLLSSDHGSVFLLFAALVKGLPLAITLAGGGLKIAVTKWLLSGLIQPMTAGAVDVALTGAELEASVAGVNGGIAVALKGAAATIGTAALGIMDAILIGYDVYKLHGIHKEWEETDAEHKDAVDRYCASLTKIYEEGGQEALNAVTGTNQSLEEALAEARAEYENAPHNMWEGFTQGIREAWSADGIMGVVHEMVDPLVQSFKDFLGIASPSTVFMEIGGFIVEGLLQGLAIGWENITGFFSTSLDAIKTTFSTAWNTLRTNTTTAFNNIRTAITTQINTARTNVTTAVTNMRTAATTGWTNMVTAARAKFQEIVTTTRAKMNEATGHLRSISWTSIGSNLVNGLLSGLRSAWSAVTSWASSAASALTNTLRSAFSIHSPSRVWAEIGTLLDAGLVQGLQSGSRSIFSTVADLAGDVTDRMDGMSASLSFTSGEDIDRLDVTLAKLEQIADVISGISAALVSMGGLTIPQVAAGTVVPAATSAAAERSYSGDEERYTFSEMLRLMQNMTEFLRQVAIKEDPDPNIHVMIDGREIYNVVVAENNRHIQMTGGSGIRV